MLIYHYITTVGIVCASENCTNGFVDVHSTGGPRLTTTFAIPIQFILPTVNFTCEGTVTGWTFVGTEHDGNMNNTIFPTFQVWRLEGSTYNLIGSSNITAMSIIDVFPSGATIYALTIEPITV